MRGLAMLIAILALMTTSAKGQSDLGDVGKGREFAQKVCAVCHRVEKAQASGKLSPAKSFQDIANNPARTELSLRVFLNSDHRNMPRLILTQAESDNVIAYILSLR